jgi:hypothetical protein
MVEPNRQQLARFSGAKTSATTSERGVHADSSSDLQVVSKRAEARAPKPAIVAVAI